MTDAWDFNTDDEETNLNTGPKPLREAFKAQKQANKELMDRLAKLEADANRHKVADMFETQGVPRSAAKYYNGEPETEKVSAFINDMRGAFGGASPNSQPAPAAAVNPDDSQKFQQLMQSGSESSGSGNFDVAMQAMSDATSTADRIAAYESFMRTARQ